MAAANKVESHDPVDNCLIVEWLCPAHLQESSPNTLSFIHKSFLEYFTALAIWEALQRPLSQAKDVKKLGLEPFFILQDAAVITFLQELRKQILCRLIISMLGLLAPRRLLHLKRFMPQLVPPRC